jgi:hypothetical protein
LEDCGLRIDGLADWQIGGLHIADCRLRIGRLADWRVAYCGLQIADCCCRLQIAGCGLRIDGLASLLPSAVQIGGLTDCGLTDCRLLLKVEFRISLVVDFDDFS